MSDTTTLKVDPEHLKIIAQSGSATAMSNALVHAAKYISDISSASSGDRQALRNATREMISANPEGARLEMVEMACEIRELRAALATTEAPAQCSHEWEIRTLSIGNGNNPWFCKKCGVAEAPMTDAIAPTEGTVAPFEVDQTDPLWPKHLYENMKAAHDAYANDPPPQQPAETITIQEAWEAAGGNPGIKATRDELLTALRQLDEVCDAAPSSEAPAVDALTDWAPARIWLQREQGDHGAHTWCEDSVGDGDIIEEAEYVRVDALVTVPKGKPVAHVVQDVTGPKRLSWYSTLAMHDTPVGAKLYAHPASEPQSEAEPWIEEGKHGIAESAFIADKAADLRQERARLEAAVDAAIAASEPKNTGN